MRDFSKVSPSLWESKRFRALSQRRGAVSLPLSADQQTSEQCGGFGLPHGYALVDLGWEGGKFDAARDALIAADMIQFDPETEEYRICRWFKHNPPQNAKHRIGIVAILEPLEQRRDPRRGASRTGCALPGNTNAADAPRNPDPELKRPAEHRIHQWRRSMTTPHMDTLSIQYRDGIDIQRQRQRLRPDRDKTENQYMRRALGRSGAAWMKGYGG